MLNGPTMSSIYRQLKRRLNRRSKAPCFVRTSRFGKEVSEIKAACAWLRTAPRLSEWRARNACAWPNPASRLVNPTLAGIGWDCSGIRGRRSQGRDCRDGDRQAHLTLDESR